MCDRVTFDSMCVLCRGERAKKVRAERMKVLLTGGSGLVGKYLTTRLVSKGHRVVHVSRSAKLTAAESVTQYQWDIGKQTIDERCLEEVDVVVHLAGARLTQQRWTGKI
jgi:NAD dependent epimerase/dehydratase family enzyme